MKTALALLLLSTIAQARPCPKGSVQFVSDGLSRRAHDPILAPDQIQEASNAYETLLKEPVAFCNFESGVAGNIYQMTTRSLAIEVNFFGSTISNLKTTPLTPTK